MDGEDVQINPSQGVASAYAEKGAKQHQEDAWCLFCSPNRELVLSAIFDGHGGLNGRVASMKCRKLSWEFFNEKWKEAITWSEEQWKTEMTNLFDHLHTNIRKCFVELERAAREKSSHRTDNIVDDKGVVRKSTGYPMHGGTTATIAILIDTPERRQVVCANVGDSDALILPLDQKSFPSVKKNYIHLSIDHGPDSADEFLRIKSLPEKDYPNKLIFVYDKSNVYRKYECPRVFLTSGSKDPEYVKNPWGNDLRPTNVRYDPAVYAVSPPGIREDVTCIAMTRSLGDFYAHQFGLTWRPDVSVRKLDPDHEYLICVGSDGIWDCWKFEDFSDFATSAFNTYPKDIFKACKHVVNSTVERAKALFGARSFDDASACFAFLAKSKKG